MAKRPRPPTNVVNLTVVRLLRTAKAAEKAINKIALVDPVAAEELAVRAERILDDINALISKLKARYRKKRRARRRKTKRKSQ